MVVEHIYPMKRDQQGTRACWEEAARTLLNHLFQGRSVAHITIGDPLIYSTSYYLLEALTEQIGSDRIHIVPGISAFQAVAARLGDTLTIQDDRMTIMSAADLSAVKQAVEACETLVLYKAGKRLDDLRRILGECGVLERAKAVFYAEQGDRETVVHDLQEDVPGTVGYMATVIVNTGRRYWTTRSE
jgi:precorrin-2/cobalt-factor-2 C20-methyltransferase